MKICKLLLLLRWLKHSQKHVQHIIATLESGQNEIFNILNSTLHLKYIYM